MFKEKELNAEDDGQIEMRITGVIDEQLVARVNQKKLLFFCNNKKIFHELSLECPITILATVNGNELFDYKRVD